MNALPLGPRADLFFAAVVLGVAVAELAALLIRGLPRRAEAGTARAHALSNGDGGRRTFVERSPPRR